jgi:predicted enzyme related to lactoylglutathione lyase
MLSCLWFCSAKLDYREAGGNSQIIVFARESVGAARCSRIFSNLGLSQLIGAGMNTKEPVSTDSIQVGQQRFEMPPREGITVAHFLTVADIDRSARWYETVFDGRILSSGDSSGAPAYIQFANTWLLVNVGGGPTPDKPTVTLSVPNPDRINSFMNIRVADIQACYELWKSRGAEFITEPIPKYGEIRCYMRDPDGYIIEVGQSTDLTYG